MRIRLPIDIGTQPIALLRLEALPKDLQELVYEQG